MTTWYDRANEAVIEATRWGWELVKWLWDFLGFRLIWRKILPKPYSESPVPHHPKFNTQYKRPPSTFFLWIVGIYVAFFGVASQIYENRVDIIENRANSIFSQLGISDETVRKSALSRISRVQNMWCPPRPDIFEPVSVFRSFS